MKKLLISFLFAIIAIGANAQITYNVRGGLGIGTDKYGDGLPMTFLQFQSNIPISSDGRLTFSPSVVFGLDVYEVEEVHLYAPLTVGYKIPIANSCMFFPKAGVAAGFGTSAAILGPTVGLDFEIKHFVIGLNGFYSFVSSEEDYYGDSVNILGLNLTLGYKF